MKIVCIADPHGMHRQIEIPDGDVFICAGDITGWGRLDEIHDFNNWLYDLPHKHKIVIAGNHDGQLEKAGCELSSIYLSDAIYLENNFCFIEHKDKAYKVWGSPITPRFMDWHFMKDRGEEINRVWNQIHEDTDILITHGPAWGILDEVRPAWKKGHLGCEGLAKRIKEIKPKLHIPGHIHDAYGIKKVGETTHINASICTEDYEPINKPIVIDL
jgi:Icc-related predicted phosphoesterase